MKKIVALLAVPLLLLSVLCTPALSAGEKTPKLRAIPLPAQDYYRLIDGNLMYMTIEDKVATYGKYDLAEKKTETIGSVDQFILSGPDAVIGKTIYEYVTFDDDADGKDGEDKTVLFAVDTERGKVERLSPIQSANFIIPLAAMERNVLSLRITQNEGKEDIKTTGIYSLNIDTMEEKPLVSRQEIRLKNASGEDTGVTGEAIIAFTCDGGKIYALLVDEKDGAKNAALSIGVFDLSGKQIGSISVDNLNRDLLLMMNGHFKVMGDCIFIATMGGGQTMFGKIVGDRIEPILDQPGIVMADSIYQNRYVLFCVGGTDEVYLYDQKTGELNHRTIKIGEKHFYDIMTDGENLVATMLSDNDRGLTYYQMDLDDFVKVLK